MVKGSGKSLPPPGLKSCSARAGAAVQRLCRALRSFDQGRVFFSRLIFLSEQHLRATLSILTKYYQHCRNHQGIENKLIEPLEPPKRLPTVGGIRCQQELGGMLNYYYREAA